MLGRFLIDFLKLIVAFLKRDKRNADGSRIKAIDWFYRYIPTCISAKSVVFVLSAFSFVGLKKQLLNEHMVNNQLAFANYQKKHDDEKFIEWQNEMTDIRYGKKYSASYNACEVIAVYNAMLDLLPKGTQISFPQLLKDFEKRGVVCKGAFGTSVKALKNYLSMHKLSARLCVFERDNQTRELNLSCLREVADTYRGFIMTSYNKADDLGHGIHTMYISKSDKGFIRHNDGKKRICHDSLEKAILEYHKGESGPICLLAIR